MHTCRRSTRHTCIFFTLHFPTECNNTYARTLTPQLAFFTPKYAVYYVCLFQLDRLLLEALIEYGADINQAYSGLTPFYHIFHFALTSHRLMLCELLMRAGVDTTDLFHISDIRITVLTQFTKKQRLLFFKAAKGSSFSAALQSAIQYGRDDIIPYLLSRGANPRCFNDSCIFVAADTDRIDTIKLLLAAGAVVTERALYHSRASRQTIEFLLGTRNRLHPGVVYP